MAFNSLEYAKIMMTKLDERAVWAATTGWMEANAGQVIYHGGDEVKIPTISTQGLADYDRDGGFVRGAISSKYETYKMTQDRGRTFMIDAMDVNETNFVVNSTSVIGTFQKTQVVPEIDAYRYATLASVAEKAGHVEAVTVTADTAFAKLKEHLVALEEIVGVETPLVVTLSPTMMGLLEENPKFQKLINVGDFSAGIVKTKLKQYNQAFFKVAPQARLVSKVKVLSGASGQEKGGWEKDTAAKEINWIICPQNLPIAISKTDNLRIFEPSVNQQADAWKIDYRKYHDLWVLKQKEDQLFVCTKAGA